MKKFLVLLVSMIMILSSVAIPVHAENSKYWLSTSSFMAPELTDGIAKGYLGKAKDVVVKDLKTRNISGFDDQYDVIAVYVVGTLHAYSLIIDNNKIVGVVIHKTFYSDSTTQRQHDAFVDKANVTLSTMKKEKNFNYETTAEDSYVTTYATCNLKNGQFMEFILNYEMSFDLSVETHVYIGYYLSQDYVIQG